MPLVLAPVGACGMYASRGEVQAAKAADNKGIPFTLSTVSICPIEEVAPTLKRSMWFPTLCSKRSRLYENALDEQSSRLQDISLYCRYANPWCTLS